ncbi:hypothetical protein AcdelDRAFT_1887 [Acidovorax delafieldii 2AN]|uniref:Uncharacterized protein n=1 Tax=Acidovorax delafieldii 2AN TaxID=573060 RepID=C5T4Q7_ACIDE|nr:hypothetical protein [Acidovorax delafieldii]EER60550.1 hypothetical protein AcdelDRAFT_1887 [Acidovorax delafieldii 2AN]
MKYSTQQPQLLIVLTLALTGSAIAQVDCPAGPLRCIILPTSQPAPQPGTAPIPKPKPAPGATWLPAGPGRIEADRALTSKSTSSLIKELQLPRLTPNDLPAVQTILGDQVKTLEPNKYYYAPSNNRGVVFQGLELKK